MILKNFYGGMCAHFKCASGASVNPTSGKGLYVEYRANYSNVNHGYRETGTTTFTSAQYCYMYLGAGTTAPTFDDYKMQNALTDLTYVTPSCSITGDYNNQRVFTQQVTNNTENPITVTEVCLMMAYSSSYVPILLTRDIISPVTIGVGETKTFVLTIDFIGNTTTVTT